MDMRYDGVWHWVMFAGPLALLLIGGGLLVPGGGPRWVGMWLVATGIYSSCKVLTWAVSPVRKATLRRQAGYLMLWPGMNADAFLRSDDSACRPTWGELGFALAKGATGVALVWGVTPRLGDSPLWRGWVGMIGLVFVLHFGIFHAMSWGWRKAGVEAPPIMNWPILSRGVAEFWGRRWNTAFRELAHRFLFQPMARRVGAVAGVLAGFVASGLVHELVISVPAEAGWGGPTAYFVLQGAAILVESSLLGRRFGLGHGWRGWCFAVLILTAPIGLLFPAPFVRDIVGPTLDFLTGGRHA